MKRFFQNCISGLILALLAWWTIASLVFAIRHPWATSTERVLYTRKALTFQKVSYNEARPLE